MFSAAIKAFNSGITANYSVSKNAQFRAGPWTVYPGKKKSTNDSVSVFVFDKKALSTYVAKSGLNKSAAEEVYDRLRREVSAMMKIRHPSILRIIEPLEDGRMQMTFVTEPLSSCLKSLVDSQSSREELDELVIQSGLLQITEGLLFLHNTAGQVHMDLQPSSILIDAKGDWKLGGLGFIQPFKDTSDYFIPQFDPRLPQFVQPNLDYAAPELVLDRRLDPSNDVFSLGCLIVCIYLHAPMHTSNNSTTYKNEVQNIQRALRSNKIPGYLSSTLPRLLTRSPMERITLEDLKRSEFFDNPLIRTINFLDDFPAKLSSEKKTFLNGLHQMLGQFPKSVLQRKILQGLVEELGKDESLVYLTMQNILTIGKDMSQLGFSEKILPHLDKVKDQFGCQAAVLDFMPVLLSRLNATEFKEHILPVILTMLDTAPPESQSQVLSKTSDIIQKLDFVSLKNDLFPKYANVFSKTTSLSVKLEALRAFKVLIGVPGKTNGGLDKYAITEKLIPLLTAMKTREPKIIVTVLDVYTAVVDIVDTETLARSLVPHLLQLSMESLLTKSQFHDFLGSIKNMIDKIERDHGKQLSDKAPEPVQPKSGNDFDSLIRDTDSPAPLQPQSQPQPPKPGPMKLDALSPQKSMKLDGMSTLTPSSANANSPTTPMDWTNLSHKSSGSTNSSVDWSRAASNRPSFGSIASTPSVPTLPRPLVPQNQSNRDRNQQPNTTEKPKGLDQYQSLL